MSLCTRLRFVTTRTQVITWGYPAMDPVNTRDPAAAARAYLRLLWPVALGHRYRPRQRCTCGDADCPTPGEHPQPGPLPWLTSETIDDAVEQAPGASLIAGTERFDAVIVPRAIAMSAMVKLDKIAPVPCLLDDRAEPTAALLVLPATGRYAACDPRIEVRTGPEGWLALPPSHGIRWDTPPWIEPTTKPRVLLHGADVGRLLAEAFNCGTVPQTERTEAVR